MTAFCNFLSLARTQRRLANDYRRWGVEDQAAGNWQRSRKWFGEAAFLRDRAWKSLLRARINRRPT